MQILLIFATVVVMGSELTDTTLDKFFQLYKIKEMTEKVIETSLADANLGMNSENMNEDGRKRILRARAAMKTFLLEEIGFEKLKPEISVLYKRSFTEEDIHELNIFLQTSTGSKWTTFQILNVAESQKITKDKMKLAMPRAMQLMITEMGKP